MLYGQQYRVRFARNGPYQPPPCPLFVFIMMNCALPPSHGEVRHMEGVNDDIERFSLVARLDGNKPVWGVAL